MLIRIRAHLSNILNYFKIQKEEFRVKDEKILKAKRLVVKLAKRFGSASVCDFGSKDGLSIGKCFPKEDFYVKLSVTTF